MDELTRLTTALTGRYQIEREIGKGGMATVYLARDVRHDRRVALKLLNPELGAVLGVERFLSEIRVTANLQHPNLLPLFDSGEVNGLLFYVMPYVDGESLRARIDREKQLTVAESVRIATAVASALDYAHRQGVIHRDLKPDNILIHDGQPLIADFGIALAVSKAGAGRITQTGLSLGTPQYMSPEQAAGDRSIDGRTDIYALGAVTYEMLTGAPPITAPTAQGVIARLMVEEPRPITELRRSVPVHVDSAVRHALEKVPADRFATAHEFGDALNATGDAIHIVTRSPSSRRRFVVAAVAIAGIITTTALVTRARLSPADIPESFHFTIPIPDGQQLAVNAGAPIAISPDGMTIAYPATGPRSPMIYVQRLDELRTSAFPAGAIQADLKFSPDGRWISFVSAINRVDRIPTTGGPPTLLARPSDIRATAWSPNGSFVYADSGAIWIVDSPGSTPRMIVRAPPLPPQGDVVLPFVMPDGKDVLFDYATNAGIHLAIASMGAGSTITPLDEDLSNILGYRDGWLIYGRGLDGIVARRFNQRTRRFSGAAIALQEDAVSQERGGVEASLSRTGTLTYARGDGSSILEILDRRGVPEPATAVSGMYVDPAWSPDGRKIAIGVPPSSSPESSLWIYDVASRALSRLTAQGTNGIRPAWTADSKRVAFGLSAPLDTAIWGEAADMSGPATLFAARPGLQFREVTFSADEKYAVLRTDARQKGTHADLFVMPLTGTGERRPVPIVQGVAQEEMPSISPDSHWLAYQSDETGRAEIYVRPFPGNGGHVQVSADGGSEPRWLDATHIVYRAPRSFWSAALSTASGTPQVTRRDSLFADPYRRADPDHQSYDVTRDGRFALFRPSGNVQIVVVTNWWAEMKAKLPR